MYARLDFILFAAFAGVLSGALEPELIPTRVYCGLQHADDYIRVENDTRINEFPWLALLVFKDEENKTVDRSRCGGSVISRRYVLTAAQCKGNDKYKLAAVRLGEYNVKNQTDCTEDSHYYECSDPVEEFGIEKVITHPRFRLKPILHDIALLRLDRDVQYTDYIRPICLPISGTTMAQTGDILTSSGWGSTAESHLAETKKKILTKRITNSECALKYRSTRQPITQNLFCTKELDSVAEFLCRGDTGGPVTFSVRNQWHQEGISSFGKRTCNSGFPEVHTKVSNYMEWIVKNIEP